MLKNKYLRIKTLSACPLSSSTKRVSKLMRLRVPASRSWWTNSLLLQVDVRKRSLLKTSRLLKKKKSRPRKKTKIKSQNKKSIVHNKLYPPLKLKNLSKRTIGVTLCLQAFRSPSPVCSSVKLPRPRRPPSTSIALKSGKLCVNRPAMAVKH